MDPPSPVACSNSPEQPDPPPALSGAPSANPERGLMAIRFDAGARRSILAATIEAEKHGRSRPLPRDLLMGLLSLPESPVPAGVVGPGADARALIAAAMADSTAAALGESPQDAERILQRAAAMAADRGAPEVGMLDILSAALQGPSAVADAGPAAARGAEIGAPPRASV